MLKGSNVHFVFTFLDTYHAISLSITALVCILVTLRKRPINQFACALTH